MIFLIALISLISLLVLHELGHFVVAKRFGVKVEEFGIFLPPRLIGKKFGETIYSINLIPLGAFVKLQGEEKRIENSRSFSEKPIGQRALIILGGVVTFWIVSAILLSIVFAIGTPTSIGDDEQVPLDTVRVQIVGIAIDSPAEESGIKVGDTIKKITVDGQQLTISKVKEVQDFTDENKGKEVILTIQRGKEVFDTNLVPRVSPPEGEGAMGVSLARVVDKSYPLWQAPIKGIETTFNLTYAITVGWVKTIGSLIQGDGLPKGVQMLGPVGIGSLIGQAAQIGINYFLQFIAIISIYLAIFNILPIPALDGGKLLFLGIEKIRKRPVNEKIEQNLTTAFFVLLIFVLIWVTIRDISRFF